MWSQLGTITTNKASGGDGIPVELFQILKHDAVKVLHSICQQIWKIQQWPQDWKRSVFIPIAKKGNAKDISLTFSKPCSSLDLALNTLGCGQIIYPQWVDFLRCKTIIFALNISLSLFEDYIKIIIVQWLSCVWLFVMDKDSWTAARQASLSITITQSSIKLMSIQSVMPSNHLILCCPLLLLPSLFSIIRVFPNESALRIRSIGASASVLPMTIQDWFLLGWTGWISLQSKGFSRVFSSISSAFKSSAMGIIKGFVNWKVLTRKLSPFSPQTANMNRRLFFCNDKHSICIVHNLEHS